METLVLLGNEEYMEASLSHRTLTRAERQEAIEHRTEADEWTP